MFSKHTDIRGSRATPPSVPSLHIRVHRVVETVPNQMDYIDHVLDIDLWDRAFNFEGVLRRTSVSDKRLKDPRFMVLQLQLRQLLDHYKRLNVPHLREISGFHNVTFKGLKKDELVKALQAHRCGIECRSLYYTFKESPNIRPSRPWIHLSTRIPVEPTNGIENPGLNLDREGEDRVNGSNLMTLNSEGEAVEPTGDVSPITLCHLDPAPEKLRYSIIREWQRKMDLKRFMRYPCAVCGELNFASHLEKVHASQVPLELLRNDKLPPHLLPKSYNLTSYDGAILNPKGLQDLHRKGLMLLCRRCSKDLKRREMPKFALCNWLYYAREHVPADVQAAFADMSVFEKALISRVKTNNILCKFSGVDDDPSKEAFVPSRRHIRGNIISTPLDIARVNSVLPPGPSDVADTMCALIVASRPPDMRALRRLTPILVRKSRVKLLIQFLLENNPLYKVSQGFRGFSQEHLDALFQGPHDSGVPQSVQIAHMEKNDAVESLVSDATSNPKDIKGLFMENVAYTLGDHSPQSYIAMTLQAMARCKKGKPFLYARTGSTPVPDIGNPNWLSWAHPNADPFGIGGFHHPGRIKAIGMEAQLKHMLTTDDPFFESDPVLAFDIHNIIRKDAVNTSLRFRVPLSSYARVVADIARMNEERLAELSFRFANDPTYRPSSKEDLDILRVMSSISPVAKEIPGTVAQRIKMRNEIRALISQKGSPTLFFTMTPADYHNPIVSVLAKRCASLEEIELTEALSSEERRRLALAHPAACAMFFDCYVKNFIKIILRFRQRRDSPGIFGVCDGYYGTVETQGRGTLHCHMLIWLKGHLPAERLQAVLQQSSTYRERLITWIDSMSETGFIGTRSYLNSERAKTVSDEELAAMKDPHVGSVAGPSINEGSRKDFEKEMKEHVDELLIRFNWHEHCATCWKYLRPNESKSDANCRFGMDGIIRPSSTIDDTTGLISFRRRNPRMTQYNPVVTFLLKCNTDIKFIGSGQDAMAFMYYVTDYITKSPISMHSGLTALTYAIQQAGKNSLLNETDRDEYASRRVMTMAINSMLGRQEFSHPQIMSFICGGGEYYTSERFQAINWGECLRYVRNAWADEEGDLDGQQQTGLTVSVTRESRGIEASNQLLDYIHRPAERPFCDMGLYRHVARTRKIPRDRGGFSTLSGRFTSRTHPQFLTHTLSLRKESVVPVLLGPKISRRKGSEVETEQWARDMCILFKPWRHPRDVKEAGQKWIQSLDGMMPFMSEADREVIINMSLISEGKVARDARPRGRPTANTDMMDSRATEDAMEECLTTSAALNSSTNAYTLLEPSSYSNDDQRDVQLDCYLESLIGHQAAKAFKKCQPKPGTAFPARPSESQGHPKTPFTPDPSDDESEDGAAESLRHQQQAYMMSCKHGSSDGAQTSGDKIKIKPRDTNGANDPAVSISTVVKDVRFSSRVSEGWSAVEEIEADMNMKDNTEQRRAFEIISHHIIEGGPQLLMYVGGKGGTGKSYLIKAIVRLFESLGRRKELRLAAFTGIAASLIQGSTLHSLLSIAPNAKTSGSKKIESEWRGANYLIIDEVSMIGAHFLALISARLKMARASSPSDSGRHFGGINVIFLGDFHQLPPPKQPSLYAHRLVKNPSFIQTRDNSGIDAFAGAFIWRQVDKAVILDQSKRHCGDPLFGEILERIRHNKNITEGGKPCMLAGASVMDHLRRREISTVAALSPCELDHFQDAPVIVGSKSIRDALNACLAVSHARRLNTQLILFNATDTLRGKMLPSHIASRLANLPARHTNDSIGLLPLFVGMKVMITENISVSYNIVNGSEGTVTGMEETTNERGQRRASVVYVKVPGCKIKAPGLEEGVVPIFPSTTSVHYPISSGDIKAKSFTRIQVPIVPAYSYTDYKSQGRTLEKAIVDITSARGQGVYVMLSRVTSLKGLLILRWFPNAKIMQRMSGELREEIERLKSIDARTEALFSEGVFSPNGDDVMPFDG